MKKFSFALVAVLLAAFCLSFTEYQKEGKVFNNKYRYTLSDNSGMDDPANYEYTTTLSGCNDGSVVCIIDAPGPSGTGQHPNFTLGTDPYSNDEGVSVFSEKP